MVNLSTIRAPLFVPADRPERFGKAASTGADAVILDLEDAVAVERKEFARASLTAEFTGLPIIVRINALGTPWHASDVAAVAALAPAAVMLPKSGDPSTVQSVGDAVGVPLIALIETAQGLASARMLAATPCVRRLAFGSVDFCVDIGMVHLRENLLPVRLELVLASRLASIAAPIDGVTLQLDDDAFSRDDAEHARSLGMSGKLCIHPKQVSVVKNAFLPSEQEVAWARRVLTSADGATSIDGSMVDEPVRSRARSVLALVPTMTPTDKSWTK
ncbi:HpcH/HpaI aldolase/citrate lyase family protein [Rhizobium giardinii]|uniref:Citrate lyase subunit beta/citryl-CoA lyase n=1 Tax=Rhizobium giardinii TaxID=56731 RepID=A0A7W8UBC2_9HYPH|nr:CoA ester lyase [Rhizobium giardinii]MBB5536173.1 citrate lyase subunit beta/citryl-CoA lyase [Rhizobium giardinii]